MEKKIDVAVSNHGTIFLFEPRTDAAREWISEHLPQDALRFGNSVVVEHRFAYDIVVGMKADGLKVA